MFRYICKCFEMLANVLSVFANVSMYLQMFVNVLKCFTEFVHWPTAGPWYTVCGFTDESKFWYKLINTATDECRPHRTALVKGNLRHIRPETDNIH